MIIPTKSEKDLINTIKSCTFTKKDIIQEIKESISRHVNISPKYLDGDLILSKVKKVFDKYCSDYEKENVFRELFKWNKTITYIDVVNYMAGCISVITVRETDKETGEYINIIDLE